MQHDDMSVSVSVLMFMMNIDDDDICEACKKSASPWDCTHKNDSIGEWKSERKIRETMLFYKPEQRHLMMRELRGIPSDANRELLVRKVREQFRDAPPVSIQRAPRAIYLGIDPGGGGPGEMGLVATIESITEYGKPITAVGIFYFYFFLWCWWWWRRRW